MVWNIFILFWSIKLVYTALLIQHSNEYSSCLQKQILKLWKCIVYFIVYFIFSYQLRLRYCILRFLGCSFFVFLSLIIEHICTHWLLIHYESWHFHNLNKMSYILNICIFFCHVRHCLSTIFVCSTSISFFLMCYIYKSILIVEVMMMMNWSHTYVLVHTLGKINTLVPEDLMINQVKTVISITMN